MDSIISSSPLAVLQQLRWTLVLQFTQRDVFWLFVILVLQEPQMLVILDPAELFLEDSVMDLEILSKRSAIMTGKTIIDKG